MNIPGIFYPWLTQTTIFTPKRNRLKIGLVADSLIGTIYSYNILNYLNAAIDILWYYKDQYKWEFHDLTIIGFKER